MSGQPKVLLAALGITIWVWLGIKLEYIGPVWDVLGAIVAWIRSSI